MQLNLKESVFLQIENLIHGLVNKKTMRSIKKDLMLIIGQIGLEGEKHMLKCLFRDIELKESEAAYGQKEKIKIQFFKQQILTLSTQSRFITLFNQIVESCWKEGEILEKMKLLTTSLELPLQTKLTLSLSLAYSHNQKIMKQGLTLLKDAMTEYLKQGKSVELPQFFLIDLLSLYGISSDLEDKKKEIEFILKQNYDNLSDHLKATIKALSLDPKPVKNLDPHLKFQDDGFLGLVKLPVSRERNVAIADLMKDIGPICTHSQANLSQLFSEFSDINEDVILDILLMMVNNNKYDEDKKSPNPSFSLYKSNNRNEFTYDSSFASKWNIDVFIDYVSSNYPNLSWGKVIKKLDKPNLKFQNSASFLYLFECFKKMKKNSNFTFPSIIIFKKWKNTRSQVEFLLNIFRVGNPDAIFLGEPPKKEIKLLFDCKTTIDNSIRLFMHLDLLELLIELSDTDSYLEIRNLFEIQMRRYPEVILSALLQMKSKSDYPLMKDLFYDLVLILLSGTEDYKLYLSETWKRNPKLLTTTLNTICRFSYSPQLVEKMYNFAAADNEVLTSILAGSHYTLAFLLAIVASQKDKLELKTWILQKAQQSGHLFLSAILGFFNNKISGEQPVTSGDKNSWVDTLVNLETVEKVIIALKDVSMRTSLSPSNEILLEKFIQDFKFTFPSVDLESTNEVVEIDTYVDKMFQDALTGKKNVVDIVAAIQGFKNSPNNRDRKIFVNFMVVLLDEFRFFPTYKLPMLQIMADLYAGVVNAGLIEGKIMELVWNIMVSSLDNADNKMSTFGIRLLTQVKDKLPDTPGLAHRVLSIKRLWGQQDELLANIVQKLKEKNMESSIPPEYTEYINQQALKAQAENTEKERLMEYDATNDKRLEPPDLCEDIFEKFDKESKVPESTKSQIISHLAQTTANNAKTRGKEIKKLLLNTDAISWMSHYMVYKKIPKESNTANNNSHKTYITLINAIEKPELFKHLIADTYNLFYKILHFEMTHEPEHPENDKDPNRDYLNNIGSWLGHLTIGRNKPIIMKDLDIKALILEAFEKRKLHVVAPLVCKILSAGATTGSIFKSNNAWVKALLSILVEIYEMSDSKMGVRCDIEVLLQQLGVKKGEIVPSRLIQQRIQKRRNMDYQNGKLTQEFLEKGIQWIHREIRKLMKIEAVNGIELQPLAIQAFEKAITEVLPEVVARIVNAVMIPTKGLVLKDFALEPDEKKFIKAARLMLQNISATLSVIVCKDPLKGAVQANLTEALKTESRLDENIKGTIINNLIAQYLNLGVSMIQRVVVEKAIFDLSRDPDILDAIEKRKHAKENKEVFYEDSAFQINLTLPEVLRASLGGLTPEQLKIYDDFEKMTNP